jgi:lipopolysaccharide transport system ATP-binding protein
VDTVTKNYGASIEAQFNEYDTDQKTIEKSQNPRLSGLINRELMGSSKVELFDNIAYSDGWKTGKAEIISVSIFDSQSYRQITEFEGGETVTFQIDAKIHESIFSPILGFFIKDKTGQSLFGEHTYAYVSEQLSTSKDDSLRARFTFTMPYLPDGVYAATVSVASGDPHIHIQHHWLHDAVVFRVASSKSRYGLVGIPFENVTFEIVNDQ